MESFVKRLKRQIKLMEKFSKLETITEKSGGEIRFVPGPEISTIAQHKVLYYDVKCGGVTIARISPSEYERRIRYA